MKKKKEEYGTLYGYTIKNDSNNNSKSANLRNFGLKLLNNDSIDHLIPNKTLPRLFKIGRNKIMNHNRNNSFILKTKNKIKEEMIHLRKEINKQNLKLKELKLSNTKLSNENNSIVKILDDVINESKTSENPIKLKRNNSQQSEIKMTKTTYKILKNIDNVSSIKHRILNVRSKLNCINSERKDLEEESKITKLKEKSKNLFDIINQVDDLKKKNENLGKQISYYKIENQIENKKLEYAKTLNKKYNKENENLENKYNELYQQQMIYKKNVDVKLANENKLKYQFSSLKNIIKELNSDINNHNNNILYIDELKNLKQKSKLIVEDNKKILNILNEENIKYNENIELLLLQIQELKNKIYEKQNNLIKKEKNVNKENEIIKNEIFFERKYK